MLNNVSIIGRLTSTPELKSTPSGVSVTAFSVAVDRDFKNQNGEKQTDFINVVAWRNTAEFICRYFTKGRMIAIGGSIQTRKYTTQDGQNRSVTEVIADSVYFCGDSPKRDTQPSIPISGDPLISVNESGGDFSDTEFEVIGGDDDLPF